MSSDFCIRCDKELSVYCGPCVDGVRAECDQQEAELNIMVEATDAQEAKQKAWDKIDEKGDKAGDVEWEFCESITTGNVCHVPYNETVVRAEFKKKEDKS